MSDYSSVIVGDWQAGILARVTVISVLTYALILVRTAHWLACLGMLGAAVGICLRLGDVRITHELLTIGFACTLLGIALIAIRIVLRQLDWQPEETS